MSVTRAYAAFSSVEGLKPFEIDRRSPTESDVQIAIEYCGVCHSDIHQARNEWGRSIYPIVPGHEIVGRVTAVGSGVSKYKIGDLVAVGCLVGSCRQCVACYDDLEQYCENGFVATYNHPDAIHGGITYGGYSKQIVVNEHFVLRVPENLETQAVAPLLCAGVTMWSPLRHWKIKAGDTVGIIGLGGLGHMGIKLAHALGAKVIMVTRSLSKGKDAEKLGADEILLSNDEQQMAAYAGKFDFLIDTIPTGHNLNPYVSLLKRDGTMVVVGALEVMEPGIEGMPLILGRKSIAGSVIGGIAETQELLDFCGKHNIVSEVEMIRMDEINTAYERMLKSDVKYRFVIDMKSL